MQNMVIQFGKQKRYQGHAPSCSITAVMPVAMSMMVPSAIFLV